MKRLAQAAGLDSKRVFPHKLRHSVATEFLRAGGNARIFQLMLGHEDMKMTDGYVTLVDADAEKEHGDHSPFERGKRVNASPGRAGYLILLNLPFATPQGSFQLPATFFDETQSRVHADSLGEHFTVGIDEVVTEPDRLQTHHNRFWLFEHLNTLTK